jgi:hypothetical protein
VSGPAHPYHAAVPQWWGLDDHRADLAHLLWTDGAIVVLASLQVRRAGVCGCAGHSCPDRAWQRLSQRLSGEIASPLGASPPMGGPVGPARALVIFGGNVWWHLCWLADWFYDIFGLTVSLGMRGRARDARIFDVDGWDIALYLHRLPAASVLCAVQRAHDLQRGGGWALPSWRSAPLHWGGAQS